jgi:glycosyltransferase involved in cell wall biosynthesis
MATFNRSNVLPCSIGSVLRQTLTDFELLVVGDACTDDSEAVVRGIGDPRIRWINLRANTRHQSGPNNEGLRQARGEYVAYLGHDDLWLPHHLGVLAALLDATGAAMAHSLLALVDEDGESLRPAVPQPSRRSWGMPSCTVHRRSVTEAIGGWRDYRELDVEPEVELWRRAQARGYPFGFAPRLTGIKFPGSTRRNVYRERPNHEQAAWLERIDTTPDLEATLLARMLVDARDPRRTPYLDLIRSLWSETTSRARRRLGDHLGQGRIFPRREGVDIDVARRFKGLE